MDTEMITKNSKHVEPLVISEIKVTMATTSYPQRWQELTKAICKHGSSYVLTIWHLKSKKPSMLLKDFLNWVI